MTLDEFLDRITGLFRKNRNVQNWKKEDDYSIKDVNIKLRNIPMSVFLVIKKYGWVVFFHKLANFVRLTLLKNFKKIKNIYTEVACSFRREGLRRMLSRSVHYIFYGKGVLNKSELKQRKKTFKGAYYLADDGIECRNVSEKVANLVVANDKETLLLISHSASATGAPMVILNMAKKLRQILNKEIITILIQGGQLENDFAKCGLVINLNQRSSKYIEEIALVELMIKKIKNAGVLKCISNSVGSGLLLPILEENGIECINLIHELFGTIKKHNFYEAANNIAEGHSKVVFSADFVKRDFVKNLRLDESRSFVRPQGLYIQNPFRNNIPEARRLLRARLGLNEKCKVILGCGYADYRKGPDLFFDVAERISNVNKNYEVQFIWLGERDKEMEKNLIGSAINNNYSHTIQFCNFEKDPSIFFAGADIFLLTSREDPFPSVVLHSMECGVPVIAFEGAGGAPEVLKNDAGVVVPFLDTSEMVKYVQDLFSDKAYYKSVSLEAKRVIATIEYNFDEYVKYIFSLFSEKTNRHALNKRAKDSIVSVALDCGQREFLAKKNEDSFSIVFLTYNGLCDHFKETLEMVRKQRTRFKFEIIAIDSGSKDGTVDFIKKQKDIRLHEILNSEFGHGKTRQLGAELAEGNLVVFLTQDATPANDLWLQKLVENFDDGDVVGVCSRVVPRKDACLLKKIEVNNDLSGRTKKIIAEIKNKDEFERLTFAEKRTNYYFFNDVSSCVRREYLMGNPFPDVPFAEDVEFAKIALKNGKKIVFEPDSIVCHSHDYHIKQTYKRNYVDAEYHRKYLDVLLVPTYSAVIKNVIFCVGRDLKEIKKCDEPLFGKIFSLLYSPIIHLSEQIGQFHGSKQECKTYKNSNKESKN